MDNLEPSLVQGTEFRATGSETLEMSWDPVSEDDLTRYNVYPYEDGEADKSTLLATSTSNSVTVTGVDALERDYVVAAEDRHGNVGDASEPLLVTSVEDANLPDKFALKQNYPNPFNPSTVVPFALPEASEVRIEIYNSVGHKVATVADKRFAAGNHEVTFNAKNLSSGIYFMRANLGDKNFQKKITLIK
mgnify:CR=1 FL=1